MLSDTKILLKEAAEREQLLLQEREDLKQKVSHSCLTPHEQFFSYIIMALDTLDTILCDQVCQ